MVKTTSVLQTEQFCTLGRRTAEAAGPQDPSLAGKASMSPQAKASGCLQHRDHCSAIKTSSSALSPAKAYSSLSVQGGLLGCNFIGTSFNLQWLLTSPKLSLIGTKATA